MPIPQGSLERKTSFFLPLLLLDSPRRKGLELLYRFCWAADDLADGPGSPAEKRSRLKAFQRDFESCLRGRPSGGFWRDFGAAVGSFRLSPGPLRAILVGVTRDLKPIHFKRFSELHSYALQVAGGPGLAAMEIFGGRTPAHRRYAENLGVYLQITNITRDFLEDRSLGRQYLPLEDFKSHGIDPHHPVPGTAWDFFVRFQLDRARSHWDAACAALPKRERGRLATAEGIAAVYGVLHRKLWWHPGRVLEGKVSLSRREKAFATLGAAARCAVWRVKPIPDDCGC